MTVAAMTSVTGGASAGDGRAAGWLGVGKPVHAARPAAVPVNAGRANVRVRRPPCWVRVVLPASPGGRLTGQGDRAELMGPGKVPPPQGSVDTTCPALRAHRPGTASLAAPLGLWPLCSRVLPDGLLGASAPATVRAPAMPTSSPASAGPSGHCPLATRARVAANSQGTEN